MRGDRDRIQSRFSVARQNGTVSQSKVNRTERETLPPAPAKPHREFVCFPFATNGSLFASFTAVASVGPMIRGSP